MSAVEEQEVIVDPAPEEEAVAAPPVVDAVPAEEKPKKEEEPHEEEVATAGPPPEAERPEKAAPDAPAAPADSAPVADTETKKRSSGKSESLKKKKASSTTATKAPPPAAATTSTHGASTKAASTSRKMEFTTGPHVNARYQTIADENSCFRQQQGVRPTYKGPVYVAEDVHVLCAECHTPVDPVTRVPVGPRLFYHEHCLRCAICGRRGVAEPFLEQSGQPVCAACVEKGNAAVQVRRQQPPSYMQPSTKQQQQQHAAATLSRSLNQTALPGAVPPSLQVTPHLHDSRNTTDRSFALMQRQQYFTQNDVNVLTQMPLEEHKGAGRGRKKDSVKELESSDTVPALE